MNVPAADAPTPSDHPAWLAFEGAQARVVVDLDAIVRNATTLKARVGDAQLMAELAQTLGTYFAARVSPDAVWARSLIAGPREEGVGVGVGTPMEL